MVRLRGHERSGASARGRLLLDPFGLACEGGRVDLRAGPEAWAERPPMSQHYLHRHPTAAVAEAQRKVYGRAWQC